MHKACWFGVTAAVILVTISSVGATSVATTWQDAKAVLDATADDIARSGSVHGIEPHVAELEAALANAQNAIAAAKLGNGKTITVLTDGSDDAVAAVAAATADKANADRQIVAVPSPYPFITLYLGSYYNTAGRFDDAARVFAEGVALYKERVGRNEPQLIEQQASALRSMKRYTEALAIYDEGLALPGIKNYYRASFYRGRGFVLIELGRLDEAETAYKEDLKLVPSSPIAKDGLARIARLRAGVPDTALGATQNAPQ